jgi:hypothetical protein
LKLNRLQWSDAKDASDLGLLIVGWVPTKRNQALIYRKVPAFLRQLREKAGLTQRELAESIGEIQSWVHRSEIGSRRVDVAEFIMWCRGCGVEPDEVLRQLARQQR